MCVSFYPALAYKSYGRHRTADHRIGSQTLLPNNHTQVAIAAKTNFIKINNNSYKYEKL